MSGHKVLLVSVFSEVGKAAKVESGGMIPKEIWK